MIRQPLAVRLDPDAPLREQIRQAATLGAKAVVLEATGDIHPDRLSETGRREVRHLLASVGLGLAALHLPTRRGFDSLDGLEERVARADRAFALAFELGTRMVLARVGTVPDGPATEGAPIPLPLAAFREGVGSLARKSDHRGMRLALETGTESGATLRGFLEDFGQPTLGASLDPATLLARGFDPPATARALGPWVIHAYANDPESGSRANKIATPRGLFANPGALDWIEYLGAFEEINYIGPLTAWPEAGRMGEDLPKLIERFRQY